MKKKCKVMHVGQNNLKFEYTINGHILEETESEKDVGVTIHRTLKPGKHCERVAATARSVLRQITKNFHFRDRSVFMQLY